MDKIVMGVSNTSPIYIVKKNGDGSDYHFPSVHAYHPKRNKQVHVSTKVKINVHGQSK